MKTQVLFDIKKMSSRIAAVAVFSLLTVQSSFAQTWPILGNENTVSSVVSTHTSVAVLNESGNEIPYVAFCENGVVKVKKRLTDGTWTQVGSNLATNASFTRITADKIGNLYVSYVDVSAGSKLALKKFDTTSQDWMGVGATDGIVSSGTVSHVHNNFAGTFRSSMAFDSLNNPYITFSDGTNYVPTVKKFDGSTWSTLGSGTMVNPFTTLAALASSPSLVIDEADVPWLSFIFLSSNAATVGGGRLALFKYDSGTNAWTNKAVTDAAAGTGNRHTSMAISGTNNLSIAYLNSATSRTTVATFDKSLETWTFTQISSGAAPLITLINDSAYNLYCSFQDNSQSMKVRYLTAGTTAWTELKDATVTRGIDEPVDWPSVALANGSTVPFVVYTKANLAANVSTPIVRKFSAPVAPAPGITNFTPAFTATTPVASAAFTISGTNFTEATAVSFGGVAVTTFTVVNNNSITGTLPSDYVFANFSVSVTTPNGTATVNGSAPTALSYPSVPSIYNGTPLLPIVTSPSTLVYTITPTLPGGMSINAGTGAIRNQPTVVTVSTTYTVTATNNFGSTTATVTFATGAAPTGLSYGTVPASYTTGTVITLTPTITSLGTGTTVTYTISSSLPAGLTLDPATGVISGTPTVATPSTVYTVKASTDYGFATRTFFFATTAPLGTDSFEKTALVKAYPNPTTDFVTVSFPNAVVIEKIAVYNNLGQLVLTEANNTVSLKNLTKGIYFLNIHTAEGNFSKRIIKE